MRILVHEYLTGGGLWSDEPGDPTRHPLLAEGRAMVEAVSQDLRRVHDVRLVEFRDARLISPSQSPGDTVVITSAAHEFEALAHWSPRVDGVLLIAPEYGGRLLERSRWVERHGGRLLSPDSAFVELATDKSRTADALAVAGVAVPYSLRLGASEPFPAEFPFPAVLKPNDGAGSLETHLVTSYGEAQQLRIRYSDARRVEVFCPGLPASVLALCGPRRRLLLLPPCRQRVTSDGRFQYLGGMFPLAGNLVQRACQLARTTFTALPRTSGFVGVDMILGDAADGSRDVVLEVNPRLTTSYVGLRRGTSSNLAAAMLAMERGDRCPLFFHCGAVEFEADGRIRKTSPSASVTL
jgi:predicted ATP-grasp superfamily ATP-dependent carboligase